jgi:hypothetical protein
MGLTVQYGELRIMYRQHMPVAGLLCTALKGPSAQSLKCSCKHNTLPGEHTVLRIA